MDHTVGGEGVITRAQPILDALYDEVVACNYTPLFKPLLRVAQTPGATHYDPVRVKSEVICTLLVWQMQTDPYL